jgi:hypothetical protein
LIIVMIILGIIFLRRKKGNIYTHCIMLWYLEHTLTYGDLIWYYYQDVRWISWNHHASYGLDLICTHASHQVSVYVTFLSPEEYDP